MKLVHWIIVIAFLAVVVAIGVISSLSPNWDLEVTREFAAPRADVLGALHSVEAWKEWGLPASPPETIDPALPEETVSAHVEPDKVGSKLVWQRGNIVTRTFTLTEVSDLGVRYTVTVPDAPTTAGSVQLGLPGESPTAVTWKTSGTYEGQGLLSGLLAYLTEQHGASEFTGALERLEIYLKSR